MSTKQATEDNLEERILLLRNQAQVMALIHSYIDSKLENFIVVKNNPETILKSLGGPFNTKRFQELEIVESLRT